MLILKHTFTRPNTSVNFYAPATGSSIRDGVAELHATGDIISYSESISESGLVMTKIINIVNTNALVRINSNATMTANKQARTAYNNANGITESTTSSIV